MTDIDFEELDRAVQSAIDNFSSEDFVSEDDINVVDVPDTTEPVDNKVAAKTPVAAPIFSSPRPSIHRPGRSLDSFSSPTAKANLTPAVKPEVVQPAVKRGPVIDIINPVRKKPVQQIKTTPSIVAEPKVTDDPVLDIEELDFQDAVKESPFIDNLKVDKRPLGAFSELGSKDLNETPSVVAEVSAGDEPKEKDVDILELAKKELESVSVSSTEFNSEESPKVEAPTYVGGVDEAHELPPELQQDILSVEATGMIHDQDPLSDENVGLKEASSSIPLLSQEVKEVERADADDTIFASEAYTKPLAHPKKNKSGWLRVFLILLLLILGIAGGVAVYYFVL